MAMKNHHAREVSHDRNAAAFALGEQANAMAHVPYMVD